MYNSIKESRNAFGLAARSLVHRRAGNYPAISLTTRGRMKSGKTLSILIDESGDFGSLDPRDPYYHVVMVVHEQQDDITDRVSSFSRSLNDRGYSNHYLHVGPLIRREKPYLEFGRAERRTLFNLLFHFTRQAPVKYIGVTMDKRKANEQSPIAYIDALTKKIVAELRLHYEYFISFDKIIVYYDYGQSELAKILVSVFNALFVNVEFRKTLPTDYILLQVADLICTMQMISEKQSLSRSEEEFFHSRRDFNKNILKTIQQKKL